MKENWPKIFELVGISEGGYVNDPDDPGGPTNKGVTQRVYDAWRKAQGQSPRDVKLIEDSEVAAIFKGQYWEPIWGDRLPSGVDYVLFDFAINSGVHRAVKTLQKILKVSQDGVMGNITYAALLNEDEEWLINAVCDERLRFVKRLRGFKKYGKGWTRRIQRVRKGSLELLAGIRPENTVTEVTARAAGKEKISTTLVDALKSPQAGAIVAPVVGAVATASSGSGPVQWALAAVLVLTAMVGVVWMMRRLS